MTIPQPDASARVPRPSASAELRSIAIEQFASAGFAGTSLQQIADAAGYSKSSVLYHFASKEALLEAALGPALDRLEQILPGVGDLNGSPQARARFIEEFIDFLLEYRLEVHTFINQGQSLRGIPVIDRGNAIIGALAASLTTGFTSTQQKIRFGVALGGAAYTLVGGMNFAGDDLLPPEEIRPALIATVSELLTPASTTAV